eukprot:SAG22_NODE_16_length_32723_cov_26.404825_35_plen_135_part_00
MASAGGGSDPALSWVYRNTELGITLEDSLKTLIEDGSMDESLADKVKAHFDSAIHSTLADTSVVSAKVGFKATKDISADSRLETYRYYDPDRTEMEPRWQFLIKDCEVSLGTGKDAKKVVLPRLTIQAVDGTGK